MRKQEDMDRIIQRRQEQFGAEMAISDMMRAAQSQRIRDKIERWDLEEELPPGLAMWKNTQAIDLGMLKTRVQAYKALKSGEKLPGIPLPLP